MSHPSTPARPTDARIVKTAGALRSALLDLLEQKPFDLITIREIAALADVHYTTFFRHHASKEALLDHIAADQVHELVALSVPVQDLVDTRAAFRALAEYVDEHRALWTILLTGGAAATMRGELLRLSADLTRERIRQANWIPEELSVNCCVSVIIETLTWWLRQSDGAVNAAHIAEMLYELVPASAASVARPAS